jgi:hypothetical protein
MSVLGLFNNFLLAALAVQRQVVCLALATPLYLSMYAVFIPNID